MMRTPPSEKVLRQLRALNAQMDPADPSPTDMRRFRDLFSMLDDLLRQGETLPPSWITPDARVQLKPHETHTITEFDPPRENTQPAKDFAWCGHRYAPGSKSFCGRSTCGNYKNFKKE